MESVDENERHVKERLTHASLKDILSKENFERGAHNEVENVFRNRANSDDSEAYT